MTIQTRMWLLLGLLFCGTFGVLFFTTYRNTKLPEVPKPSLELKKSPHEKLKDDLYRGIEALGTSSSSMSNILEMFTREELDHILDTSGEGYIVAIAKICGQYCSNVQGNNNYGTKDCLCYIANQTDEFKLLMQAKYGSSYD